MRPRPPQARTIVVAALACAAAVLALASAALRSQQGSTSVDTAFDQEIREQLESIPDIDSDAGADAARILASTEPAVRTSDKEVADAAGDVLRGYEGRSDCVLGRSGYLGLAGSSWACLACGGDWAEVCVVTAANDDGSEVRTWRITAAEVEALDVG